MKDLSLHILDVVHNSISAGAKLIKIELIQDEKKDLLELSIEDNGKGIPADKLDKVADPFFTTRTTRKVGLGLPLLRMNAERTGGTFSIESTEGVGTKVKASFGLHHLDRPPLGDMAGVMSMLASSYSDRDFNYHHITPEGEFVFDTIEVKEALDGVPMTEVSVVKYLEEFITENLAEIKIIE